MEQEIKVLLIEDSPSDALLIKHQLQKVGDYRMMVAIANRLEPAIARLSRDRFDVVLSDLGLPDSNGPATFMRIQEAFPRIPLVVLTGADDEAAGVEAIRRGVQDYLVKGTGDGKTIARSIRYAIERKQAEADLQEKNAELALANRELESFSYSVAHDLRNPLNGILACSALLDDEKDLGMTDEQRTAVAHIVQGAHRMSQIITDLLELSKITRHEVRREPVDHLPYQTNFTGAMGRRLAEHFGISEAQLQDRLGNHLLRVDLSHTRPRNTDGSVEYDWWGAGWDTRTEGYWHSFAPLANSLDLDGYAWPDPDAKDLLEKAHQAISSQGAEYFVVPNFGMCLYERAWSLRGFDALLMDMADRPEWVEQLLRSQLYATQRGRFGRTAPDDERARRARRT